MRIAASAQWTEYIGMDCLYNLMIQGAASADSPFPKFDFLSKSGWPRPALLSPGVCSWVAFSGAALVGSPRADFARNRTALASFFRATFPRAVFNARAASIFSARSATMAASFSSAAFAAMVASSSSAMLQS